MDAQATRETLHTRLKLGLMMSRGIVLAIKVGERLAARPARPSRHRWTGPESER
ncbi:MAG: hypothetical protein ACJAZO_003464 [Myxococcota bacterium]|jgi:hypothetical protein